MVHYWEAILEELNKPQSPQKPKTQQPNQGSPIRQRLRLTSPLEHVYLTYQESHCIYYLLQGKTMKQTALALGLSHRTVEFYFNNVKDKIGCRKKQILLSLIRRTNFLDIYQFPLKKDPKPKPISYH